MTDDPSGGFIDPVVRVSGEAFDALMDDLDKSPSPGRVSSPHVLVVADEWDEDGDCLTVEHPTDCPTVQAFSGVDQYDCPVANEIYNCGLEMFFLHRDDPEKWSYAERLGPGRYEIEVWSERHPGGPWGPDEWSGGLRTVETTPASTPTPGGEP